MASAVLTTASIAMPVAWADNKRLNDAVVANVYTIQRQAGCLNDLTTNPALQRAAQRHALDVLNHRDLTDDVGSDGSTVGSAARSGDSFGHAA